MNDYQAGLRHNLEIVEVFDDSSIMGDLVPEYKGLTTLEARKLIVKKLEELGALVKTEDYTHNVGKCYRCHNTVEPRISNQWFVKMKELAEPAIKAVKEDDIKFIPKRYEKHILTGWKIFKIGVYHVNYGGDIEYQHIIVMNVDI